MTMKRCFDPKCEFFFPQLIRGLRKLLEKCFKGDVKNISFTEANKKSTRIIPRFSGCYRYTLKGCGASVTGLRKSGPI